MSSSSLNSPKATIPVLRGSKFSPSPEKSSLQQHHHHHHRTTFHLSNLFQSLTKFSRNIRTTNSFVRSTSTNSNDPNIKLTRRSFTKHDSLSSSINRPSSCFILLSPAKQEQETCLFFRKPIDENLSPKSNSTSSFSKLKRVSSFLLPLKRRQSLSLNHSLHERSFKAKESSKRRSRLLNYSIFKHKNPISRNYILPLGTFGYRQHSNAIRLQEKYFIILFDIIQIDLILEIRLNNILFNNYESILYDTPDWAFIQSIKSFYGILLDERTLTLFQPKLFENNLYEKIVSYDFIFMPFHHIQYEDSSFIHIGYDSLAPTTIRIPLTWISNNNNNNLHDFQISSKFTTLRSTTEQQNTRFMHDHHQLIGNASLISEALRHYQRLENENNGETNLPKLTRKSDKHRRPYHIRECRIRPIIVQQAVTHKLKSTSHHFDPIQLRRKQCSSTLIDEEIPIISNRNLHCLAASSSSSSSGFRSNSRSSSIQTSSLAGCIANTEIPMYANVVTIESSKLVDNILDGNKTPKLWYNRNELYQDGWYPSADTRLKQCQDNFKRANVIKEIYKTEHDYLGHLKNLVDGYLKKMRLRKDLFSEKQIELLLGNIEEIYHFQQAFFQLLKLSINEQNPHESLIGKCFLLYKEEFKKYSDYCINHPLSCLELTKLENNFIYQNFFETCRLQANMIELKLDGFLLSPIQRICQYPLQLNELLKYTKSDHRDYENIQQAVITMRDVASFINERKRRMEYVEIIHKWQSTVENWQGKNLIETSTQGLGRADAYLYQNGKKEQVTLFLFDHVLIICRKDRRNCLIYFGRADLDNSEFEDLIDGKVSRLDEENIVHLLFAWRLFDSVQNKSYLFSHRTPLDKMQMIDALEYERAYVEENLSKGLEIPLYTRLATLKTQQYLADQPTPLARSTTATSFPLITKPNRSISAILRTSNSQYNNQSIMSATTSTAIDHPPVSQRRFAPSRKSSLPRFSIEIISTQRGKRKLLLDGYIYRLDRSNDRGIEQWRCSKKNCRGRIYLYNSFLFSSTIDRTDITLASSHSHASEPAQCEAAIAIDHVRTSAHHNQHESPKDIIHRLLRSVSPGTAANLPSITTAIQRSMQRKRQQRKSFDAFLMNIEHEKHLSSSDMQILCHSINDNFLLHLTDVSYNQMLVLTCKQNHQNRLANSSMWLCTTFHEAMN
ncbi:unnamed protein product [Rotaria magnacalcarata]|uniref:DH domain-containing protein n=2 Tax=Rotaria magnacalcarata TaxID=392030 RepID=A0A816V8U3_9BILA|nr:unnamed protein product [Rotaria magnacalcarata]